MLWHQLSFEYTYMIVSKGYLQSPRNGQGKNFYVVEFFAEYANVIYTVYYRVKLFAFCFN